MFCVLFFSMYLVVDQLGRLPSSREIFRAEVNLRERAASFLAGRSIVKTRKLQFSRKLRRYLNREMKPLSMNEIINIESLLKRR